MLIGACNPMLWPIHAFRSFTEHPANPMAAVRRAPEIDATHSLTTPRTQAMAEGHVWLEDGDPLIYVYHTIRWNGADPFAPQALGGRNGEDLGVEVFSPTTDFDVAIPAITKHWQLSLEPGGVSPCAYDVRHYRYCLPLKAVISASGREDVLLPSLSFVLAGLCEPPPPPTPPGPPPVPVCAEKSTHCDVAAWKCKLCKAGANNPTDCLGDCLEGYSFNETCDDCTGVCQKAHPREPQAPAASTTGAPGPSKVVATVTLHEYDAYTDTVASGPALARLPVSGQCMRTELQAAEPTSFRGTTTGVQLNATWVVAVVSLAAASAPLAEIELTAQYVHRGPPVPRPRPPIPPPPPCTSAPNATKCAREWNCSVCKKEASNPTDCLKCNPGFVLGNPDAAPSGDCTGPCLWYPNGRAI